MTAPLLEVRGASKTFGAVVALYDADVQLRRGEVLAVLGDNGAGKSTLIKCISGVHRVDAGEILIDGEPVVFRSPSDARNVGIETVYQDLALFDNVSATSNFFAGREITTAGRLRWLNDRRMRNETREILDRLGVRIPSVTAPVGLMSGGQRQGIAVARAAAFASKIVILDEPTAALGVRESRAVLDLVRRLPTQGVAVILISHNIDHVVDVADRAIVLRHGTVVGSMTASPATRDELVHLIVGGRVPGRAAAEA